MYLSSTKIHKTFSVKNVPSDKQCVVPKERETLAQFVQRIRNSKDLSLMDVRVRSGLRIATSYVSRIENGNVTNVGLEKLRVLAKGLGVPEDDLLAIARGKSIEPMTPTDFFTALAALGITEFHAYGGAIDADDRAEIIENLRAQLANKVKRKKKK